jgi:hypothetical protein
MDSAVDVSSLISPVSLCSPPSAGSSIKTCINIAQTIYSVFFQNNAICQPLVSTKALNLSHPTGATRPVKKNRPGTRADCKQR